MSRPGVKSKHSLNMGLTIKALQARRINFQKMTEYHLKVGEWNFFPSKETIYRDGDPEKLPERGLAAFLKIIAGEEPDGGSSPPTSSGPPPSDETPPVIYLDLTDSSGPF